ncbi:hypothetical protein ACA910_000216 [Epithemia clementina (nom. ined.)]
MTNRPSLVGLLLWSLFSTVICFSVTVQPTFSTSLIDGRQQQCDVNLLRKFSTHCQPSARRFVLYAATANSKTKKNPARNGGGGFGAASRDKNNKQKAPSKKQILKRVEQVYGGTSPEQIARATQEKIQSWIRQQPPPVQMALQLYQQLQQWEAHVSQLSVLQQAQLEPAAMEGATRARQELDRLYQEHATLISSDQELHNLLQKYTWDASADAKLARSLVGDMSPATVQCIERACQLVSEVVVVENNNSDDKRPTKQKNDRLCLDVGCGFGVLVPFLVRAGIPAENIHGVDLSPEMIRNAQEQHPTCSFTACDFLNDQDFQPRGKFHAIIFCSSLHDLPDPTAALVKATALLADDDGDGGIAGGRIVIVHPQGASHVLQQKRSNPVLVKRGLPDANDLRALPNLRLVVEPTMANDTKYLAVLEKLPKVS